jgi:hypothetical protein
MAVMQVLAVIKKFGGSDAHKKKKIAAHASRRTTMSCRPFIAEPR